MLPGIRKALLDRNNTTKISGTQNRIVKEIMPLMAFLIFYLVILKKYDAISSFYVQRRSFLFEGMLSVIIFLIIFITQRRTKLRYINSALPLLFVYVFLDIYFKSFGTVFKLSAINQLWELIHVADFYVLIFLVIFILVVPVFILTYTNYREWRKIVLGISIIFLIVYCIEWNPRLYLKLFHGVGSKIDKWSDAKSVQNGRLAMLFYWEAKRAKVTKDIENVRLNDDNANDLNLIRDSLKKIKSKRSVHLVILESFFDPSLLSKINFSRNPMHPNMLRHVGDRPALSKSPVFGGRSAQAEFEILVGVPAFSDYSDIEFSVFGGRKINQSLPALLSDAGYITIATNSLRLDFFNSDVAYKGLGFQEAYFPKEYSSLRPTYFSRGDVGYEKYMFDGDLFEKNLDYYFSMKKNSGGTPIFNYVVSNYGHFPFAIDYNKRPKIVNIYVPTKFDKEPIERITNQFYYRTEALGMFLDKLKNNDPEAVVVIVGDHLPTLEPVDRIKFGYKAYDFLGYLGGVEDAHEYSFLFITCSGKKIYFDYVAHYNIPEIILDCISDGDFCRSNKCFLPREKYHERYVNIMAQAISR